MLTKKRGQLSDVTGAGLRLFFNSANAQCNLRLEPRENRPNAARIFAAINYHYEVGESGLPGVDIMRSDFLGKWGMFNQLLEGLMS